MRLGADLRQRLLLGSGVIALLYVIVVVMLLAQEREIIYAARWSRRGLVVRTEAGQRVIQLRTSDGLRLDAILAEPAEAPKGTVLYLHGNATSIWSDQIRAKLSAYQHLGYRVLVLDYRGYGRSEGEPSEAGLVTDALAGARWLAESLAVGPAELVIHGMSLGSGVAASLAVQRPPRLLILDGAYPSLPDVAAEAYPWIPVRLLMRNRFNTLARLDSITAPVLHVHARNDDVIPYRFGERLAAAGTMPRVFLTTEGGHVAGAFAETGRFGAVLDSMLLAR